MKTNMKLEWTNGAKAKLKACRPLVRAFLKVRAEASATTRGSGVVQADDLDGGLRLLASRNIPHVEKEIQPWHDGVRVAGSGKFNIPSDAETGAVVRRACRNLPEHHLCVANVARESMEIVCRHLGLDNEQGSFLLSFVGKLCSQEASKEYVRAMRTWRESAQAEMRRSVAGGAK